MRFVVQRHEAKKLHYDLRLEMGNVLKSWAMPKEPSNVKNVKRLAIQTEDHDPDYINFEGIIPEGYGKGKVEIWDRGKYDIESRKDYKIVFILHGKKLKGRFCLLKFEKAGEKDWLFFKIE
ncbi:MAG: 3'-phosphoesterase [Candidatus Aenigmarchaeota archaeon]|nr:3'-phosphoesterase [Candidatus Aenigmarchaeota archaeon]